MDKKKKTMTYEEQISRLEEIVETISSGKSTLSDSLLLFEEGEELCKSIDMKLTDFEGKIKQLNEKSKKFEDVDIEENANQKD